jgi:hypothetical protein
VLEDPVGTPPFRGHAGIGKFWDFALSDPSRQITPRLEEIRACGNQGYYALPWRCACPMRVRVSTFR